MEMTVTFPGNLKVDAEYEGFTIRTDQPVTAGGDESAPAPFSLFLASIGTCAGIYLLSFLKQRGLDTQHAGVTMRTVKDPETGLIGTIELDLNLPDDFPEKYNAAVVRAVELCAVKRHLIHPPEFVITTKAAAVV
jgi:putative redox protein